MCRWLAYSGAPIHLEEAIFRPEHSLIDQSLNARQGETTTNGDGFGIGWYGNRDFPGVYRDIQPAWNDANLQALAAQIESRLFFAHIRAATGTAVQRTNCHPFQLPLDSTAVNNMLRAAGHAFVPMAAVEGELNEIDMHVRLKTEG